MSAKLNVLQLGSPTEVVTPRLCLREPRRADLEGLHDAILETLPELVHWLPWARRGHSRSDTRRYLRGARLARAQRSTFEFVVEKRADGAIVGIASLHRIDWMRRSAGLGYWVRTRDWGAGLATEAAGGLALHAFEVLGLNRLEAHVALDNSASHRVVARVGFRREGIARESERIGEEWVDHVQYSLLARDAVGKLGFLDLPEPRAPVVGTGREPA
ncbi:MAG: GNAT family N-acetyltransferase [Myxococcota bacterium]